MHIIRYNIQPSKQQKKKKYGNFKRKQLSAWMDLIVRNGNRFEAFETVIFENEVAFARVLISNPIGAYEI